MLKKIVVGISFAIAFFSAVAIATVGEVDNWWQVSLPWVATFVASTLIGVIAYNMTEIRRYTYPSFVCLLAWMYNHKLIATDFSHKSYIIYRRYHSYEKLFEVTQRLYDAVMFTEV